MRRCLISAIPVSYRPVNLWSLRAIQTTLDRPHSCYTHSTLYCVGGVWAGEGAVSGTQKGSFDDSPVQSITRRDIYLKAEGAEHDHIPCNAVSASNHPSVDHQCRLATSESTGELQAKPLWTSMQCVQAAKAEMCVPRLQRGCLCDV